MADRTLFWIAAAVVAIAELLILRAALSGRTRGTAESESSPTRRAVELAYAVVPALALVAILYLTWRAVDAPATAARGSHVPAAPVPVALPGA
jgi:heme/copper-type cytochrome/quinol oxidase subunit 2